MSYFVAVFARGSDGVWAGVNGGLDQTESLEGFVEFMHDAARAPDEPVILFLEENDEWFAVIRVDGEGEPRVFISDLRAPLGSELAAMIYEGVGAQAGGEEAEPARAAAGEPGGDVDLLTDLGVTADELTELCVEEGLLPADALTALAERLDFVDELDKLR